MIAILCNYLALKAQEAIIMDRKTTLEVIRELLKKCLKAGQWKRPLE